MLRKLCIIKRLGDGGPGEVFLCRTAQNELVVLKRIPYSGNAQQMGRAAQEVSLSQSLHHPGIVRCLDAFYSTGFANIVLEYAPGGTLAQLLSAGRIDVKVAFYIAAQLLETLSFLHEKHLVHRDVKPQNVLVFDAAQIKFCDFGVSKPDSLCQTLVGTLSYLSPQICKGEPYTAKTDVFSAGIILFQLFHGAPPFNGTFLTVV